MELLIERAKAGDTAAMEQLLATVAPSIQRFGIRMCRNDDDAKDVLQDALLTIANHLGEFEGRSSFSSWAFTLARSACNRKRRGLKNQPHLSLEDTADSHEVSLTPEQQVADREIAHALNWALDRLPEDYREVILLRDVEDLTAPETAESLGISIDAVKSRLHRARRALRDALKPVLEPHPQANRAGCPDVLALWSRKLEGDLSPVDCAQMEKHMEKCPVCASACSALKAALFACRRVRDKEVGPEVQAQIRVAVEKWVAHETSAGAVR
jgi:RNA polymerase sigma-70 factor (ECF subfamily)